MALLTERPPKRKLLTLTQIKHLEKSGMVKNLPKHYFDDYLYAKWYYDKQDFVDIFLPHWKEHPDTGEVVESGWLHREIDALYESGQNSNMIMPRWFAKTTRILVNVLRDLVYSDRVHILYIASGDLGELSIGKIRRELEMNMDLKRVFGKLCPEDADSKQIKRLSAWKQSYLMLLNGNSIATKSKNKPIRGQRKTKIIIDDPQEYDDITTKEKRDKFNRYVFTTLFNVMLPWNSYMVVIGTVIHKECFVCYLRDVKKWNTLEHKAIENDKSIRPEMRPLEALYQRKKDIGTNEFNQEFMNIPLSAEDAVVRYERIQRFTKIPLKRERLVLAVDPNKKWKTAKDPAWLVLAGLHNDKRYILRSKSFKLSSQKMEELIHNVWFKTKADFVLQEWNIEIGLIERLIDRWVPVVSIVATTDKRLRLYDASGDIERGDALFAEKWLENLVNQITNYPDTEHDDEMDALTMIINHWKTVSKADVYVVVA